MKFNKVIPISHMNPVKVIVQGIPLHHDDGSYPDQFKNEYRKQLERLLATYGPVKCTYLWTDEAENLPLPRDRVVDNFAHIFYKNCEDSVRACQAASNHELQFNGCTLTLTPVLNSWVPIGNLDNDCLIKIFSKLDLEDRLKIEAVCPRWTELAEHCWSNMKKLDLSVANLTDTLLETYLMKCGRYLKEIICRVTSLSLPFLVLIGTHCEKIKSLEITIQLENQWTGAAAIVADESWQARELSSMFRKLSDLKSLKYNHGFMQAYNFFQHLPNSVYDISVTTCCPTPPSMPIIDLTRLYNLQALTLRGHRIRGLNGLENLMKLTQLDLSMSIVPRDEIEKIENLRGLKRLEITGSGIEIDDQVLSNVIRNLQGLEILDISGLPNITDRSLQLLSMLPNLRVMKISQLNNVTLSFMDPMPSLEELICRDLNQITNERICRLISLSLNLRYLDVSDSSITTDLFELANSTMKNRKNNVILKIITSLYSDGLNIGQLSPLLKIDFTEEINTYRVSIYDDLYDDVNEDDYYGINDDDMYDLENDDGFELF